MCVCVSRYEELDRKQAGKRFIIDIKKTVHKVLQVHPSLFSFTFKRISWRHVSPNMLWRRGVSRIKKQQQKKCGGKEKQHIRPEKSSVAVRLCVCEQPQEPKSPPPKKKKDRGRLLSTSPALFPHTPQTHTSHRIHARCTDVPKIAALVRTRPPSPLPWLGGIVASPQILLCREYKYKYPRFQVGGGGQSGQTDSSLRPNVTKVKCWGKKIHQAARTMQEAATTNGKKKAKRQFKLQL